MLRTAATTAAAGGRLAPPTKGIGSLWRSSNNQSTLIVIVRSFTAVNINTTASKTTLNKVGSQTESHSSDQKYYEDRQTQLESEFQKRKIELYPYHRRNVILYNQAQNTPLFSSDSTILTIPQFISSFSHIEVNARLPSYRVEVRGRIYSKRESGKSLYFYDIRSDMQQLASGDSNPPKASLPQNFSDKLQIMADQLDADANCAIDFGTIHTLLKRGDIVSIRGFPGRTKRGELTLFAKEVELLSPCLHQVPLVLTSDERYRSRYLDLIVNERSRETFVLRSHITKFIRTYLEHEKFLEVETPYLHKIPSGAAAKPFVTYHKDLKSELFLRISPELYLKQLVVGGLDRVFEIGRCFRNESIDYSHNPEFTTCEAYAAYWDIENMILMTEDMLSGLVKHINQLCYNTDSFLFPTKNREGKDVVLDFTTPFKRLDLVQELEKELQVKMPRDLEADDANQFFVDLLTKHNIPMPPVPTTAHMIDKLVAQFIEKKCEQPTILMNHPVVMSPLAKRHPVPLSHLSQRFELFILSQEFANSYTELNDPKEQKERFRQQMKDRNAGDEEAQLIDQEFCESLEYGLPPTGGWGLGIDRLVALLTKHLSIKDVILFPSMRTRT